MFPGCEFDEEILDAFEAVQTCLHEVGIAVAGMVVFVLRGGHFVCVAGLEGLEIGYTDVGWFVVSVVCSLLRCAEVVGAAMVRKSGAASYT